MVSWTYWAALLSVLLIAVAWRLRRGEPIGGHALHLGAAELTIGGLAVIALVFHCLAMFVPILVPPIAPIQSMARAITDLGPASQVAYWVPAAILLAVLRGLPVLVLGALAAALLAVGVTMFWPFALGIHLAAIAVAVSLLIISATQTVEYRSA